MLMECKSNATNHSESQGTATSCRRSLLQADMCTAFTSCKQIIDTLFTVLYYTVCTATTALLSFH